MQPPSILWPFPWWTAVLLVIALLGFAWLITRARVAMHDRHLKALEPRLRELGLALTPSAFSVGEGKNVLVVDADRLAVADLKYWRVAQTLTWDQAISLKIYEQALDRIEFRIVMHGGAQTRRICTGSIAGFGRLFILFGKAGKPVEYVAG